MEAVIDNTLRPGDRLMNGSIVVDSRVRVPRMPLEHTVICVIPGNNVTPYATWIYIQGETFWGHYFVTLQEAFADFMTR